jgi:excisionase family DNA binding protein
MRSDEGCLWIVVKAKKVSSRKKRTRAFLRASTRPVTAREFADLCGVELKTVHGWVSRGVVASFRTPGRHLRFLPSEVRAFLEKAVRRSLVSRPRNGHR